MIVLTELDTDGTPYVELRGSTVDHESADRRLVSGPAPLRGASGESTKMARRGGAGDE